MNVSRTLTFLWTPFSLAASLAVVLVTAGLGLIAWRRSGYRRSVGMLEALRLLIVALAAALLNQPEWIEEFRPEEKPSVAVLVDATPSMDTRDVVLSPGSPSSVTTRRAATARLADPATWESLRTRRNVVIRTFTPISQGRGSDLNAPLAQVAATLPNLRGVVFASDGDWTDGLPPVQAAIALRTKSVPVFAVPVGSPTRLPDVELLSLDAPTFGVAGKAVRIPFTIESSLPREYVATVTLRRPTATS